jgi:hypothetical protein
MKAKFSFIALLQYANHILRDHHKAPLLPWRVPTLGFPWVMMCPTTFFAKAFHR